MWDHSYRDCEKIFRMSGTPTVSVTSSHPKPQSVLKSKHTLPIDLLSPHTTCTSLSHTQRGLWVYEHVCLQINAPVIKLTAFAHFQGDSTTIAFHPRHSCWRMKKSGRQLLLDKPPVRLITMIILSTLTTVKYTYHLVMAKCCWGVFWDFCTLSISYS